MSFIGKMVVHHEAPGRAIKQALKEGMISGLVAHAGYTIKFDAKRTLLSGSVVFQNQAPAPGVRGYYLPGVIWIDATHKNPQWILSHEVIHSLRAERGAAIKEWHYDNVRFNWLVFASGVPAFLNGWPEHDTRWHEIEANKYAGPNPR